MTGVTVESAHATFALNGRAYRIADLPGIYSFRRIPEDERVARDYLIRNRPSAVINIVDASNLERSLYLTSQLLDMRVPLVVALNQVDVAERHGIKVDARHLAQHLVARSCRWCFARRGTGGAAHGGGGGRVRTPSACGACGVWRSGALGTALAGVSDRSGR